MPDEKHTFETARVRLEEIVREVRKKDISLEKSLDLLEEGVRLANICTELVDHADVGAPAAAGQDTPAEAPDDPLEQGDIASSGEERQGAPGRGSADRTQGAEEAPNTR